MKGEKIAQISKSRTMAAAVFGILRKTFRTLSDRSSLKVSGVFCCCDEALAVLFRSFIQVVFLFALYNPAFSVRLAPGLPAAHPRIGGAVNDVDQKIDHHKESGSDDHRGLNHGIIPVVDRVQGEPADPRPGKDELRNDRASQKQSELKSDDVENRDEAIAQDMAQDDCSFRNTLETRIAHIVHIQDVQDAGSREPCCCRCEEEGKG